MKIQKFKFICTILTLIENMKPYDQSKQLIPLMSHHRHYFNQHAMDVSYTSEIKKH